jgi:hypothetical protein
MSLPDFFRDGLGCSNALFLDGGEAPGLYAPALGRNDAPAHGGYGPHHRGGRVTTSSIRVEISAYGPTRRLIDSLSVRERRKLEI